MNDWLVHLHYEVITLLTSEVGLTNSAKSVRFPVRSLSFAKSSLVLTPFGRKQICEHLCQVSDEC